MAVKFYQSYNKVQDKSFERFFMVDTEKDKVLQVCTGRGESNRNGAHGHRAGKIYTGVYYIKRMTFLQNYYLQHPDGLSFVKDIDRELFEEKYNQTIKDFEHEINR